MTDKPTHTVKHPGLYRRVNGKLQPLKVGTELTLKGRKAKQMMARGFVAAIDPDQNATKPVKPAQTGKEQAQDDEKKKSKK